MYTLACAVGLIGAFLMWRATQLEGAALHRAFVIGLALEVCAVLLAWLWRAAAYRAKDDAIENQLVVMRRRMRDLEGAFGALRGEWDEREAARALAAAGHRADVHQGRRGWVQVVPDPQKPSTRS